MANEIKLTCSLTASKGGSSVSKVRGQFTATWNGDQYVDRSQVIGTTHELLEIPAEITTAGVGVFRNLDATNYVELGVQVSATFYPLVKIPPGESCIFRLSIVAAYAKAHTASVKLAMTVLED